MFRTGSGHGWGISAMGTVAVAVLATGCGGGSSKAVQPTTPSTTSAASTPAAATSAASPAAPTSAAPVPTSAAVPPATSPAVPPSAPVVSSPAKTTTPPAVKLPVGLVPDPAGKFNTDPAVIAFGNWQIAVDQAYLRLEGSYAPLVALSSSAESSFVVSDVNKHKSLGDHQKGPSRSVVVAVKSVNVTHRRVEVCHDLTTGYWQTASGARRDKLTVKYSPIVAYMIKVDGVWKADNVAFGTFSCKGIA